MKEAILNERKRKSFGRLERLENQIMLELRSSGYLEELAELSPQQRGRFFDKLWGDFSGLIRSHVLDDAARTETLSEHAARLARHWDAKGDA